MTTRQSVARGTLLMPKMLSIIGILVAIILILVFAIDLAIGVPFGGSKASSTMNIGMIVGAAILAYLGWSAFREQR
jgi:hypothetical protein